MESSFDQNEMVWLVYLLVWEVESLVRWRTHWFKAVTLRYYQTKSFTSAALVKLEEHLHNTRPILMENLELTLALWTPHHCDKSPGAKASRNDWIKLPFLLRTQAITEMRTLSCHPAKQFTYLFSRCSGHLSTSSKILAHIMQSDITIKENIETILQLAANMRTSCLRPKLYPVRKATLEMLCLRSYILSHMFRDQIKTQVALQPKPKLGNQKIFEKLKP